MKPALSKNRTIHIIGIGGIGMSAIAEILHKRGYRIQGSDNQHNANMERLAKLSIPLFVGQEEKNIENVSIVIISSAIMGDNVELRAAREADIPVLHRSEALAEIMAGFSCITITGTHGKTTTTALISVILEEAGLSPSMVNGGIVGRFNSNAQLGSGKYMVAEADESDGSFLALPSHIGVVTNMDAEHLAHYGSLAEMEKAFAQFLSQIDTKGLAIICRDHKALSELAEKNTKAEIMYYGIGEGAGLSAFSIRAEKNFMRFHLKLPSGEIWESLVLSLPGQHNVQNALAAIAVALHLGIEEKYIRKALSEFSGVRRRFQRIASHRGIEIIDDYAHHPVEISAALEAAKYCSKGRIFALFEPHRYSRVGAFFDDFCESLGGADFIYILPVYAAGEKPVSRFEAEAIAEKVKAQYKDKVVKAILPDMLYGEISQSAKEGDIILCMGAGAISGYAHKLAEQFEGGL
ncbi:MAG: UDP-N-acetylmuramate--L-alanine ligase [Parvibaculales bacterium]